jgi:hypothetical protein
MERFCSLVVRIPGYRSRGPGSILQRYQIFWEVVGLERGPFSLESTTEELFERKSGGSGIERRDYGCRDPSHWSRGTFYPQTLPLTSPTISGGRSVGIILSRTKATEFSFRRSFNYFLAGRGAVPQRLVRGWKTRGRCLSPGRVKNFHFSISSARTLGPTHPIIPWIPGAVSPAVNRPGRGADHSPLTSAEDKKAWIYTSISPIRLRDVVLS